MVKKTKKHERKRRKCEVLFFYSNESCNNFLDWRNLQNVRFLARDAHCQQNASSCFLYAHTMAQLLQCWTGLGASGNRAPSQHVKKRVLTCRSSVPLWLLAPAHNYLLSHDAELCIQQEACLKPLFLSQWVIGASLFRLTHIRRHLRKLLRTTPKMTTNQSQSHFQKLKLTKSNGCLTALEQIALLTTIFLMKYTMARKCDRRPLCPAKKSTDNLLLSAHSDGKTR